MVFCSSRRNRRQLRFERRAKKLFEGGFLVEILFFLFFFVLYVFFCFFFVLLFFILTGGVSALVGFSSLFGG